ncbi:Uncharacterized protein (Fragment) OS=uncultured bacterium PE=4 SV=1 [Gemmata massiliana]|uniref:Uncharacterized protein n=1 Tax=Gemmata massiliana TaxID=1210884 RepID=A0A6P2CVY1_9BACT
MTEAEWLACNDPLQMLDLFGASRGSRVLHWLRYRRHVPCASKRKLRLFAAGCCRLVRDKFNEHQQRIDAAEDFADGVPWPTSGFGQQQRMEAIEDFVGRVPWPGPGVGPWWIAFDRPDALWLARFVAEWAITGEVNKLDLTRAPQRRTADREVRVLRDLFGNPFRPVAFAPAWRTSTAVAVASQMYEARDFSAMPILGDALQDAGCDSAEVLDHCRDAGAPHVRGCWVVDLVLGRE